MLSRGMNGLDPPLDLKGILAGLGNFVISYCAFCGWANHFLTLFFVGSWWVGGGGGGGSLTRVM